MTANTLNKPALEHVSCNLCNGRGVDGLFNIPDLMLDNVENVASFVKCRNCGLVYQNPRPAIDQMGFYYPREYTPFNFQQELSRGSQIQRSIIQYGFDRRRRIVLHYKKTGKLLDVGCATGEFLNSMSKSGRWQLLGIEIDQAAADIARRNYQLEILNGTVFSETLPSNYYDVVTLWEVLEHIHNPLEILKRINNLITPDGYLIIRLPNLSSFDAACFGKYWAGYDSPRHLYIFDPGTIQKMMEKAGFHIVNMNCRSGGYASFMISANYWMKGHAWKDSNREFILKIIKHPLIRLLTFPLFSLIGLSLRGPTLTIVAQRRGMEQKP
jgi:SAM-dependent methyltransferase